MNGWLIVNGFLHTKKFSELTDLFLLAAKRCGVSLTVYTNCEILVDVQEKIKEKPDFVLFWDKDVFLAKHLENQGIRVFNKAKVIEICDDKGLTALYLENHSIKMPKTILAPFTYQNIGYTNYDFLDNVIKQLSFPFIVKENKGSFGQQVYLVSNKQELLHLMQKIGTKNILFQEFIQSSFGRDVRLYVIGKKVVLSVKRIAQNGDFKANVSNGGTMVPFTPSKEFIEMAQKVARILDVDFAGIDLLFDENEKPIFCEINSNAHFKNVYKATGVDLSILLVDYILENIS